MSPTDVSASDEVVFAETVSLKDTFNDPANLGEPVITMTTEKAVGEELFGSYMWNQLTFSGLIDFRLTGYDDLR